MLECMEGPKGDTCVKGLGEPQIPCVSATVAFYEARGGAIKYWRRKELLESVNLL